MGPRRLRAVHPDATRGAKLVLVEAIPSAKTTLTIEAPLILADAQGQASEEARRVVEGDWADAEQPE